VVFVDASFCREVSVETVNVVGGYDVTVRSRERITFDRRQFYFFKFLAVLFDRGVLGGFAAP